MLPLLDAGCFPTILDIPIPKKRYFLGPLPCPEFSQPTNDSSFEHVKVESIHTLPFDTIINILSYMDTSFWPLTVKNRWLKHPNTGDFIQVTNRVSYDFRQDNQYKNGNELQAYEKVILLLKTPTIKQVHVCLPDMGPKFTFENLRLQLPCMQDNPEYIDDRSIWICVRNNENDDMYTAFSLLCDDEFWIGGLQADWDPVIDGDDPCPSSFWNLRYPKHADINE